MPMTAAGKDCAANGDGPPPHTGNSHPPECRGQIVRGILQGLITPRPQEYLPSVTHKTAEDTG